MNQARAFRHLVFSALVAWPCALHAQLESQPDFERNRSDQTDVAAPARLVPPVVVYRVEPQVPRSALLAGVGGTVVLKLVVDDEGFVARAEVVQSAGNELDDAALGAACNLVFEPATLGGVPTAVELGWKQTFVVTPVSPPDAGPPLETADGGATPAPDADAGVPVSVAADQARFSGQVRTAGTKEVVADAEVTLHLEDGSVLQAVTDRGGHFSLEGVPKGTLLVRVNHTDHEPYTTTESFSPREHVQSRIFIARRSYNRFETVVRDRTPSKEVTRISLSRDEVSRMAGTMGDPLRAIENLPSMGQGALLGGQLLVRGTPPRNTAVYLDGVQIPQLYHFGLLRSVIHPEFLESIDVYPGGFGPQYGRAIAGVVDVKSRKLQMDGFRAQADLGFLESGFFFGGPITLWGDDHAGPNPRRITVALAGRRSYFDALLPLALAFVNPGTEGGLTVAPSYSDYQGKLEWRPSAAHTFSVMAFGSDDLIRFGLALPTGETARIRFQLQFHRLVARWQWRPHARLTNDLMVYAGIDSAYLGLLFDSNQPPVTNTVSQGGLNNTGPVWGFRNELRYSMGEEVTLALGMDAVASLPELVLSTFDRTPMTAEPPESAPLLGSTLNVLTEERRSANLAPYLQAVIRPLPWVQVIPGFRLDGFLYSRETQILAPGPRLAFRAEPVPGTVFKGTTGFYAQAPRTYETSRYVGNPRLQPERSWQNTVGLEQRLTPFLTVAIQGFWNERRDVIQGFALPINVDVDVGIPLFQTRFDNATIGRTYGMDLLVRHEITKNFYGFVGYTLSKSELRKRGERWWQPFNFDQTHIITAVGQYRVPWRLPFRAWSRSGRLPRGLFWNAGWSILSGDVALGARWRYITGNPTNYITAAFEEPTDPNNPDAPPAAKPVFVPRFKPYHQLDVRVDYKMPFDLLLLTLSLDIINVYNNRAEDGDIPRIPFLPVFTMTGEF